MTIALNTQQIAKNALDGQTALTNEVTDLKGSYKIEITHGFTPSQRLSMSRCGCCQRSGEKHLHRWTVVKQ